jgi:hypothetical protein
MELDVSIPAQPRISTTLALNSTHSLPEGLQALLQHDPPRLQMRPLLCDLRRLGGDVLDLLLGHRRHYDWGEDDIGEGLNEVTLNDCLGDIVDKYFSSSL